MYISYLSLYNGKTLTKVSYFDKSFFGIMCILSISDWNCFCCMLRLFYFTALWDPNKVTADQIFRVFYLIHLGAMLEPESQISGVVVIMDFKGLGLKQVKGFTPSFSLRLLTFIQVITKLFYVFPL